MTHSIAGKDFIDTAFQTARQVLPNAKLYYNDYSTTDAPKLACIYNLVSDLKNRGIPIDGVGHQMHINLNYPGVPAVLNAITMLAGLGIDQQITEMDISVGRGYTFYANIPASVFATQGSQYGAYFDLFRQMRGLISSVTTWGMADDHTWLDSGSIVDAPLLFDQGLQAKPAYYAVLATTTAVAGPKNATATQNQIQLDGSASTSFDGKPLTYQWTQTTGPTASIGGANSSTPMVQLVSGAGTYQFVLTVTDSIGVTATDTVSINYVGR
jgi:endo-1,4-beta-xylanase